MDANSIETSIRENIVTSSPFTEEERLNTTAGIALEGVANNDPVFGKERKMSVKRKRSKWKRSESENAPHRVSRKRSPKGKSKIMSKGEATRRS